MFVRVELIIPVGFSVIAKPHLPLLFPAHVIVGKENFDGLGLAKSRTKRCGKIWFPLVMEAKNFIGDFTENWKELVSY